MNIIERSVWLRKVPKHKREELKLLLSRNNFHDIKDVGNEDYVINIINQDYVVDRQNCEGELNILSASSRFEIKSLRYLLRFGETNDLILQKPENLYLTNAEDTIKRELDYQVSYGVKIVEPQIIPNQYPQAPMGMENVYQAPIQNQHQNQNNYAQPEYIQINMQSEMQSLDNKQFINNQVGINNQINTQNMYQESSQVVEKKQNVNSKFELKAIYNSLSARDNAKISLTAYSRDGVYGVNIDVDNNPAGEIEVIEDKNLDDINKLRALTTCIFMAQSLGSYFRMNNSTFDIKFYYFEDEESSVQPPENFIDLSGQISNTKSN